MDLSTLGYSEKWLKYGFVDEEHIQAQLIAFKDEPEDKSQFRFASFCQWLHPKETIDDQEIKHFIQLALEDEDTYVAGSAMRELFTSSILSEQQFEFIKKRLPEFGDWTTKLITREVLLRRIKQEKITNELFESAFEYKEEYKDNRPLFLLIDELDDVEILTRITESNAGKSLKKYAAKKLKRVS